MSVSVIIPAYNQGQFLSGAIESVLGQTFRDFELLIVDDGSTDDTREVAISFSDPRLRYVYQENQGLSAARNAGIRNSHGSFLTFLDSDDLFLPNKLAVLLDAFETNPDVGLVAGQAVLIDERGQPLGETFDRGLPEDSAELLLGNPLHVGSILLRRDWQERVGYFDERLRSYEDWDLWLRLARTGCPMGWVPQPISLYRFHDAQMTRIGTQMTQATFAVLDNTFSDPDLPASWWDKHDEAYSRGYLRAAAQAYTAGDLDGAQRYMSNAVSLFPDLCTDDSEPLSRIVAGWANHAKTREPLKLLESIYDNLPNELSTLARRRNEDLAHEALQLGFAAMERGDPYVTRAFLWRAVRYQPRILVNRGLITALLKATFQPTRCGDAHMDSSVVAVNPISGNHS